jgi:hypothetical protein
VFSTGADVEGLAGGGFTRVDRWRELRSSRASSI